MARNLTCFPSAMTTIFVLAVLAGSVWYFLNNDERAKVRQAALNAFQGARAATARERRKTEAFAQALRERTRFALVTPAIVVANLVVFILRPFGGAPAGSPESLVEWGASFGPRTTNGEWWRLFTSFFVHSGFVGLFLNMAALFQVGVILERLVGRLAFATVYVVAGMLAAIVSLFADPIAVNAGAGGAVCGVYGLLLATMFWSLLHRSPLTIPLAALKPLGGFALIFAIYNLLFGPTIGAALGAGFAVGLGCGLVFAREVRDRKPESRQLAVAMASTLAIVTLLAVPLNGISDVRPEIARLLEIEARTAAAYEKAVKRFTAGAVGAEVLTTQIDRTIVPELDEIEARLKKLGKVPPEHRPLVASAEKYLKLRKQSWQLRSRGLRSSNIGTLRKADRAENEALERLRDLKI